jgi:DNA-directed RNA polymerase specialized sigma24 family protein
MSVEERPATLPIERPAEFDAKVMARYSVLKNRARRITKNENAAVDLVTDTIMLALKRWQSYRDGPTMWPWLCLTMKECARSNWSKMNRAVKTTSNDIVMMNISTQPSQYHSLALRDALKILDKIKHGDVLIDHSLGHSSNDIARNLGISQQAVINGFGKARERLKDLT